MIKITRYVGNLYDTIRIVVTEDSLGLPVDVLINVINNDLNLPIQDIVHGDTYRYIYLFDERGDMNLSNKIQHAYKKAALKIASTEFDL